MQRTETILLWLAVTTGLLLRLTDLTIPDFSTDEAQAALAASAAWTPWGMQTLQMAQWLFGPSITVARGVSSAFGIVSLLLLYGIAQEIFRMRSGSEVQLLRHEKYLPLLVTAIAALWPSHILFSRLAYLSVQLVLAWMLLLYFFLRARREQNLLSLLALFAGSVYATMIKTQGLLLPLLLLLGTFIEQWKKPTALLLPLSFVLACSLLPVSLYIVTHPGIAATVLLYGGNMYGVSEFLERSRDLFGTWWHVLRLALLALLASLPLLRRCPWPLLVLLTIGMIHGFLLGPSHAYYTTDLVLFALPLGLLLARFPPLPRSAVLTLLLFNALAILGPVRLFQTPWTYDLYRTPGYWNTHAPAVNTTFQGEKQITVLGEAGHHLRFYLEPELLVGKNMRELPSGIFLIIRKTAESIPPGEILYEDTELLIMRSVMLSPSQSVPSSPALQDRTEPT
jgi:4-amino-4-deoxy-L-arabinose transferase-like glycosyltransferase